MWLKMSLPGLVLLWKALQLLRAKLSYSLAPGAVLCFPHSCYSEHLWVIFHLPFSGEIQRTNPLADPSFFTVIVVSTCLWRRLQSVMIHTGSQIWFDFLIYKIPQSTMISILLLRGITQWFSAVLLHFWKTSQGKIKHHPLCDRKAMCWSSVLHCVT